MKVLKSLLVLLAATILGTAGMILDSGGLYLVSFLLTFAAGF